jgi:hypothetical protein
MMQQCKNQAYNQFIKSLQIACLRQNQVCIPRDTISNHLWPAMITASKGNNSQPQQPPNSPPSAFSSNNIWKKIHQIPTFYDKKSLALTLVGVALAGYTSYRYFNTQQLDKPVNDPLTSNTTNIEQENIL